MSLKKIAVLTIVLLIPSFVYFIMCPFAHSFTASKCQQLIVMQHLPKDDCEHKEYTTAQLCHHDMFPFDLQVYYKTIIHSLQPSLDQELSNKLSLLKTTRLNI